MLFIIGVTLISSLSKLTLDGHQVHIWQTHLDLPAQQVEEFVEILSTDEKARADRFYFPQHRQRFIVGRAKLRLLLSRYLDIEPNRVQFEYSARGKPLLAESFGNRLKFNLSHSQEIALYGFTLDRYIGVDLEYLNSKTDVEDIAKRFFSAREYAQIIALSPQLRREAFFRGWTVKEAYLKATGDGLAGSLDTVEVCLNPAKVPSLLAIKGDSQIVAAWSIYHFAPMPNYLATVVVEDRDCDWQLGVI